MPLPFQERCDDRAEKEVSREGVDFLMFVMKHIVHCNQHLSAETPGHSSIAGKQVQQIDSMPVRLEGQDEEINAEE
jgi:hypothetical protein